MKFIKINKFSDGKQSSTIICDSQSKFIINNQKHDVEEFNECRQTITGSVLNNNLQCGNNQGIKMNIGFQLSDGRGFVNLIEVCYNKRKGNPIYTTHVIQGKSIKNSMKVSNRPSSFKTTAVSTNFDIASSFTKSKQMERFESLLGREKAEEYLNKTYLARGHLAPDGDMIFASWQWSTYYFINVVPQFQSKLTNLTN